MKKEKRSTNALFNVPNNEEGQYFLHLAKKYATEGIHFQARGRNPNHEALKKEGRKASEFKASLPPRFAKNLALYFFFKNEKGEREGIGRRETLWGDDFRMRWFEASKEKKELQNLIVEYSARLRIAAGC